MSVRIAGFEVPTLLELCYKLTGNERLCQILAGVKHEEFKEALMADIVDFIPIIGDILNISRVTEAEQKRYRLLQVIDFILGETQLPDILPSNIIRWWETHKEKTLKDALDELREQIKIELENIRRGGTVREL